MLPLGVRDLAFTTLIPGRLDALEERFRNGLVVSALPDQTLHSILLRHVVLESYFG